MFTKLGTIFEGSKHSKKHRPMQLRALAPPSPTSTAAFSLIDRSEYADSESSSRRCMHHSPSPSLTSVCTAYSWDAYERSPTVPAPEGRSPRCFMPADDCPSSSKVDAIRRPSRELTATNRSMASLTIHEGKESMIPRAQAWKPPTRPHRTPSIGESFLNMDDSGDEDGKTTMVESPKTPKKTLQLKLLYQSQDSLFLTLESSSEEEDGDISEPEGSTEPPMSPPPPPVSQTSFREKPRMYVRKASSTPVSAPAGPSRSFKQPAARPLRIQPQPQPCLSLSGYVPATIHPSGWVSPALRGSFSEADTAYWTPSSSSCARPHAHNAKSLPRTPGSHQGVSDPLAFKEPHPYSARSLFGDSNDEDHFF